MQLQIITLTGEVISTSEMADTEEPQGQAKIDTCVDASDACCAIAGDSLERGTQAVINVVAVNGVLMIQNLV